MDNEISELAVSKIYTKIAICKDKNASAVCTISEVDKIRFYATYHRLGLLKVTFNGTLSKNIWNVNYYRFCQ